jgi:hypothetical protein
MPVKAPFVHSKSHLSDEIALLKDYSSYGLGTYTHTQANDYFPFGMAYTRHGVTLWVGNIQAVAIAYDSRHGIKESPTYTKNNRYLYKGKEEQPMPGKWLDYCGPFVYETASGVPCSRAIASPAPVRLSRMVKKQVHKNFLILSNPVNTLFHEQ